MNIRYVTVNARSVFNLTSPRYLPQLARHWFGIHDWWSPCYEPVRDLCERVYIEEFNLRTGHYRYLESSLLHEGFRNPVMLTAGKLNRRKSIELPPHLRNRQDNVVCEYVGGSRLLIAAQMGLFVPAIVNDYADVFAGQGEEIAPGDIVKVKRFFKDTPRKIVWSRKDGSLYLNHVPYSHYPERLRITANRQCEIRRQVLEVVMRDVRNWMAENDR